MIVGETGTGKELVARALHYLSDRRGGPFVPVNCGAVPEALFENEMFGHGRGAYTDARSSQKGLVALAQRGTLLLDEVDALGCRAQVALLRFLQDQEFRPLGSDTPIQADVRVVAATNADLQALIAERQFREDLLFRLDVALIRLPPLRERDDDALLLANHFLRRHAAQYGTSVPVLDPAAVRAIRSYRWPGNVRELENAMHRAAILAAGGRVKALALGINCCDAMADALCEPAAAPAAKPEFTGSFKEARARTLERFERRYVQWLLNATRGNVSQAARTAQTERRHLGRIIKRAGLTPAVFRAEAGQGLGPDHRS